VWIQKAASASCGDLWMQFWNITVYQEGRFLSTLKQFIEVRFVYKMLLDIILQNCLINHQWLITSKNILTFTLEVSLTIFKWKHYSKKITGTIIIIKYNPEIFSVHIYCFSSASQPCKIAMCNCNCNCSHFKLSKVGFRQIK